MPIKQTRGTRCFFIARRVRFCHLLHQKTMAIAMGHFMLAERTGYVILIDTEEQIVEWDSVDLKRYSNDTDPRR
jgi:hypothetical protein